MNIDDVNAVIESAKARGRGSLDRFLRSRLPDASEARVQEAGDVALEIIDSVPVFLARAEQAAGERGLTPVVVPILDEATRYILSPMDVIPEMTHGLAGLLDDAYLVLRVLSRLGEGPNPLLDWDLTEPLQLLAELVGRDNARQLDLFTEQFMAASEIHFTRYWESMAAEA